MAEDKKAEAESSAAPAAGMDGPKMIMGQPLPMFVVLALNALVMIAGLGYVFYIKIIYVKPPITDAMVVAEIQKNAAPKPKLPTEDETEKKVFTETYTDMTVNLRTTPGGKSHFATIEIALACHSEACLEELKAQKAKVQDTIQSVIASRSYTELNSLETKARVKYEIEQQVNAYLADKPVTDVYFSSFVVQ